MSTRNTALLAVVAAMALSGCGGADVPPPPPATSPSTSASETPAPSAPPSVSDPVDLSPYARHPCAVLTARQVTDLGLPAERIEELSVELRGEIWQCEWAWDNNPHKPVRFGRYMFTVYPAGDPLAKSYQDHSSPAGEPRVTRKFEEHDVRGLPAVTWSWGGGDLDCEVVVGAGNGQGFTISAGETSVPDAGMCPRLVAAAELIVDTVRG
ncbi:DUF3558 family protein [Actinophytocola sp.]|uniref:DUF3558 family protein n=1 Tax=Actinophytocola sp. TaxID=1872138 RepID=UPI00389A1D7E